MLNTLLERRFRTLCSVCGRRIGPMAKRCVYCGAIREAGDPEVPPSTTCSLEKGAFHCEVQGDCALVTVNVLELRDAECWRALVPDILWLLEGRSVRLLILDCSRVGTMSSMFFGQMVRVRKALVSRKVQLRICGLSAAACEAFQTCRLDKIIPVYGSLEDALTA